MPECKQCGREMKFWGYVWSGGVCSACQNSTRNYEQEAEDGREEEGDQKDSDYIGESSDARVSPGVPMAPILPSGWGLILISMLLAACGALLLYDLGRRPLRSDEAELEFYAACGAFYLAGIFGLSGVVRWGASGARFGHLIRIERQNEILADMVAEQGTGMKALAKQLPGGSPSSTDKSEAGLKTAPPDVGKQKGATTKDR